MGKARDALFATHEIRRLPQIPSALSLIENHDVFDWRPRIDQRVITKVVNILDKGFDALTNFAFAHLLTVSLSPRDFVARQRFAKDGD